VHTAIKHGINYFDTAPYYGIRGSETILGKALSSIPRDKFYVATKVARFGADEFDFSAQATVESVKTSLKLLQVDYIDVIQVHDIEFGDIKQVINETLPTLRKLKEDGLVRHLGVTGLPIKALRTVTSQTDVDMILSYCHYCLNDSSLAQYIPELKAKNIGVVNASPLAMGLLTLSGPQDWHPAPAELKATCKKAAEYCHEHGFDLPKLALKYSVRNKDISTNLVGMKSPKEVLSNISPFEVSAEEDAMIQKVLEILGPVQGLQWPQGRLENN